ncbi:H-NS histone family protein [Bacillus sp. NP157]|nr:H-NS histone family protein [Bacillus sp. NP157]
MSLEEIRTLAQAAKMLHKSAREQIEEVVTVSGLTLPQLFPELFQGVSDAIPARTVPASAAGAGKTPTGREKKVRPPLYAEPEGTMSLGRTWSGQGHRPLWVENAAKKGGAAAVEAMLLPGGSHSLGVRTWLEELRVRDAGKTRTQLGGSLPAATTNARVRGRKPGGKKPL